MSIDIVRGTSEKPAASSELIRLLSQQTNMHGQLFIGYPIIGTPGGRHLIDALLVSKSSGIVIFDLIEGTEAGDYAFRQDDSANKLEARLKSHRELMHRRDLLIPVWTVSFAPSLQEPGNGLVDDYPYAQSGSLVRQLDQFTWPNRQDGVFEKTLSAIQSISTIRRTRTRRGVKAGDSRGAKLKRLEESIATLDPKQSAAVIETVEGVQRIRGLAGSGKTIVLALKAAYLHLQHPEWRIAVTFYTRSLKGQFRRLINNFFVEQASEEPDWENLQILTSWGAPGGRERDGMYHQFCQVHDAEYFDFLSAKGRFPSQNIFTQVCENALAQVRKGREVYDAILVDEAQDFSPAFLRLCHAMLKGPKRLVYAYDELQNLSEESLPSPEEVFGQDADGFPNVRFNDASSDGPRQDIILEKCYRNSRPVLVTAHALGFGIYREPPTEGDTGLIQMFDNPGLWTEVGYQIADGELSDDRQVTLRRTTDTSPRFLEEHSTIDDLIQFIQFDSEDKQADWLASAIKRNLDDDELRYDDIVVINPDPRTTRSNVGPIRRRLFEIGINSHLAGVDTDPDIFFREDEESVTFTGVFRAKGNEAGMIYVINAQDCHSSYRNLASIRNQLFTAITRSKSWIRVLGVGGNMNELTREYDRLKEREFKLEFTYPNAEQREQLRIVHRDMTSDERQRLRGRQKGLDDLVEDLETGKVRVEDFDEGAVARLKKHLR